MTRPHCLLKRLRPALLIATTLPFTLSVLAAASAPAGGRPGGGMIAATNAFGTNGISPATHPKFKLPTREDLQRQEQFRTGTGAPGNPPRQRVAPRPLDPVQRAQMQRQVDEFLARREREAPPVPAGPQIVERGPHHNRWETYQRVLNVSGRHEVRTNSYVELGTGLNRAAGGEWVPARALVELAPGGAVATQGAHKASFGSNRQRQLFLLSATTIIPQWA